MAKPPQYVEKFEFTPIVVRNPLIRFFGGLTFGLTVLALILLASTLGEFLPQDEKSQLALKVVFRTWWYRGLLITQGVNLILNTYMTYVQETYAQFLPIFRKNADAFKPLKIKHRAGFKEAATEDSKTLMASLARVFHLRGYRTFFDGNSFYGHRGLIARFGSTVTHLGLITIILGALAESLLKTEGTVAIAEGETTDKYIAPDESNAEPPKHPLGVTVTLHDFDFLEYPGSTIALKYKSTMTFAGASKEPLHDYVRVNHDIKYGGWTFHQNSYNQIPSDSVTRYFVSLKEKLPDGSAKTHRLESYAYPQGREVKPLPGYDDRFLSLESSADGKGVIWTVASKDKIFARAEKSTFGDLRIEMLRFYPDYEVTGEGWVVNRSNELKNPAAQVEISSNNMVIFRDWVSSKDPTEGQPKKKDASAIDLVMLNYELAPGPAASAGAMGKIDPASMGMDSGSASVAERAIVTVSLRNAQTGRPMGDQYKLKLGQSVPLAAGADPRYTIPGNYEVETLKAIPAYISFLSVSKNPGIPIVWLGAILATFGPVVAFFVSRRRAWAYVDMNKKAIWFGGDSRYSREDLEDEIAEVAREWSATKEAGISPPLNLAESGSTEKLSVHL